jgi:NitT/TauT family transport system permease protein
MTSTTDPSTATSTIASPSRGVNAAPLRTIGATVLSLLGFVLLWQLLTMTSFVNTKLIPSPVMVGDAAVGMWTSGVLLTDAAVSLRRALVGYATGASIGVVLGLLTGRIAAARLLLNPILTVLRPIPAIALVPVAIVWFGIGENSKYFVIAYAVLLAVWLNTHAGASAVPQAYLRASASLGSSRLRTFTEVVIPASAPFIITGLRLGATVAFLSLVAAELTGASDGIGYRLQEARQFLATDRMFVGLIELGILGAVLDLALAWLGRRLVHWEAK